VEHGIDLRLLAIVATSVVAWGLVSARLQRLYVSAAIVFVLIGLVVANEPVALIDVSIGSAELRTLAEVTLALLLFSDAARVNLRKLRHDADVPLRLLGVGLPLTIAAGAVLAVVLFPDLDPWSAALIAAAVAPTDAALGAQVVEDPQIPLRIRRTLNVESGLNDGIATPFVSFFIAAAAAELVARPTTDVAGALGDLAIGVVMGVAIGVAGGLLMSVSDRRGWSAKSYRPIIVLALALLAYSLSVELGANGFVAAFVGGLAFGTAVPEGAREPTLEFDDQVGELLSWVVWFLFGAVMVTALEGTTWQTVTYAVLSLTLVRIAAVAIALIGTHLHPATVLFVGWFGPRGLASVVFALLAFDALGGHDADVVLTTITLTVLLSVIAHGVSAAPLSRWYGKHQADLDRSRPEHREVPALASRSRANPEST
jgi:NhaP-type Na+/H+ or K+/H+ antiporter